ncbi:uncharacterized protein [Branchiostoma lanceolatum]|uniref:uncharacterized protein isoform X3 n=1 Tax=Branchiostoma lanceolatum TaxID=7740 RepID=UPI003455DA89
MLKLCVLLKCMCLLYAINGVHCNGLGIAPVTPNKVKGMAGETVTLPVQSEVDLDKVIAVTWSRVSGESGRERVAVYMYSAASKGHALKPLEGRASLNRDGSLRIDDAKLSDEGLYVMTQLMDDIGQTEEYVKLIIIVPPKVSIGKEKHLRVHVGSTIAVNCTVADSKPDMTKFEWRKNGVLLNSTRLKELKDQEDGPAAVITLVVTNVTKNDAGKYTCRADNVVADDEESVQVEVMYPAKIINVSRDVVVDASSSATFYCYAEGNPPPNISWFRVIAPHRAVVSKQKKLIQELESKSAVLKLNNVRINDSGEYICTTSNGMGGEDYMSVRLSVRDTDHTALGELPEDFLELLLLAAGVAGGVFLPVAIVLVVLACRRSRSRSNSQQVVRIVSPIRPQQPDQEVAPANDPSREPRYRPRSADSDDGRRFARAKGNYNPQDDNELKLKTNDVVQLLSTENSGWYFGYLDGRLGLIPAHIVEIIQFDNRKRRKVRDKRFARALYDYSPQEEGELRLQVYDVIEVLNRDESGWWYGRCQGSLGVFPSNYVEVISVEDVGELTEDEMRVCTCASTSNLPEYGCGEEGCCAEQENVEGGIRRSPTWCDLCPPSESGECCQQGTERPCYDSGLSPSTDRGCYGQASAVECHQHVHEEYHQHHHHHHHHDDISGSESTSDYWGSPENGTEYVNEGAAASSSERRLSRCESF